MDDQFSKLENKVLAAIAHIQELRQTNEQLGAQCSELRDRLQDLEDEKDRLQRQLQAAREAAAAVDDFEAKKKLIEQKVSGLLAKLEAMG